MTKALDLGTIPANANQEGSFVVQLSPPTGGTLVGAAVTCQIGTTAQPSSVILKPTVTTSMVGNDLRATCSWTKEQSVALEANAKKFTEPTMYRICVDLALAGNTTSPVFRFFGELAVTPGGIA